MSGPQLDLDSIEADAERDVALCIDTLALCREVRQLRQALATVEAIAQELTAQRDWLASGERASDYGLDILAALGAAVTPTPQAATDPLVGYAMTLDREEWGHVMDGLIALRASAQQRQAVNSASTSGARADDIAALIHRIAAADPITGPVTPTPQDAQARDQIERLQEAIRSYAVEDGSVSAKFTSRCLDQVLATLTVPSFSDAAVEALIALRWLRALPLGLFVGANRYDTDDMHVLHLWTGDGKSFDVIWPLQRATEPVKAPTGPVCACGHIASWHGPTYRDAARSCEHGGCPCRALRLASGLQRATEQVGFVGPLDAGDWRCPVCGNDPIDPTLHGDGCPTIDTPAQFEQPDSQQGDAR